MEHHYISIAHVPRELAPLTGESTPTYRKIYESVLNGLIPAEQIRGRWFVSRNDLPAIAETFQQLRKAAA
jgi:hypothetical protein